VLFIIIGVANSPSPPSSTTGPVPTQEHTAQAADPPAPTGPATSFGDGTYVVGTDIVPGTYKTSGPAPGGIDICYWSRLKDTTGNFDTIIANDVGKGPTTATISRSDGAFKTSGCNTWQKVG
jgi:hypothetical protein